MPGAIQAKGNLAIQVQTAAGPPPVFTSVPGVRTISGGGATTARTDVTAFDSPGNSTEYLPGLTDPQPLTFDMNFVPADPTQNLLRTANIAGTTVNMRLLIATAIGAPKQEGASFSAIVTKYGAPTGNPKGELTISVELTPQAIPTWAAVP